MAQFILRIQLDDEAMQTGFDIAGALRDLSNKIEGYANLIGDYGLIMDQNGNSCGMWRVK